MFNKLFYLFITFTFLFPLMFLLNGCGEDDPILHQEEHFEAIGVFIHSSGVKVVSILRGETQDTLVVPENNESELFSVQFYNGDEKIIDPPSSGKSLDFEIDDTSVAYIHQQSAGSFEFKISGKQKGNTHLELFLMHEGHSDFRSGEIPVRVE